MKIGKMIKIELAKDIIENFGGHTHFSGKNITITLDKILTNEDKKEIERVSQYHMRFIDNLQYNKTCVLIGGRI